MTPPPTAEQAEQVLAGLAAAFLATSGDFISPAEPVNVAGAGPDYEARYKALIEHIPGVIFVAPLQAGHGNAYVSPQIETILGFTQEEWLDDPIRWYERIHADDKERWSIEAASLFLRGQPLSSTYRVIARDGRVIWFQCEARMVHSNDGKPSFIQGIGFDVTTLKEAEASLQKAHDELERRVEERTRDLARINVRLEENIAEHKRTEALLTAAKETAESAARVKTEFMANISHELRTPMNGVLGMTSLVLKTDLSPEQREYISMAHSSAESLLGIINQVLDFARADAGRAHLLPEPFQFRSSVRILIGEMWHHASQKGVALDCVIMPDVPDNLIGDPVRLRQVLTNLLGNAIKFTALGRVDLVVELDWSSPRQPNSSCVLRFSVKDTGMGIPASKIEAIFEPFVQADGSITREFGGTGLGLAISKEIVSMMGGRIDVISEPGIGSTFSFTANFGVTDKAQRARLSAEEERNSRTLSAERLTPRPSCASSLKAEDAAAPARSRGRAEPVPTVKPTVRKAPLRVLVVEDNPVNQKLVTRIIAGFGHSATLANNGLEAVSAYRGSKFDIILMDIQMPVMDGLSATEAIREIEAQRGDPQLPIIGLTAHALAEDRERCLQAGMNSFLPKPFKPDELMALMEELTGQRVAAG